LARKFVAVNITLSPFRVQLASQSIHPSIHPSMQETSTWNSMSAFMGTQSPSPHLHWPTWEGLLLLSLCQWKWVEAPQQSSELYRFLNWSHDAGSWLCAGQHGMCGRAGNPATAPGGEEENPVLGRAVIVENSSRTNRKVLL